MLTVLYPSINQPIINPDSNLMLNRQPLRKSDLLVLETSDTKLETKFGYILRFYGIVPLFNLFYLRLFRDFKVVL